MKDPLSLNFVKSGTRSALRKTPSNQVTRNPRTEITIIVTYIVDQVREIAHISGSTMLSQSLSSNVKENFISPKLSRSSGIDGGT